MATSSHRVEWYGPNLLAAIAELTEDYLEDVADIAVERAQQIASGSKDTGFRSDSYYKATPRGSTYGRTPPTGRYRNKRGHMVKRTKAPQVSTPSRGNAAVGNAAAHDIWLEDRDHALYQGMEYAAQESDGILRGHGRRHLG